MYMMMMYDYNAYNIYNIYNDINDGVKYINLNLNLIKIWYIR